MDAIAFGKQRRARDPGGSDQSVQSERDRRRSSGAGYLNVSYNAGATWTGDIWYSNLVTSADIPWLASANTGSDGA